MREIRGMKKAKEEKKLKRKKAKKELQKIKIRRGIIKLEDIQEFKKVYRVFELPPYNEKYTDEELEEIFEEYKKTGEIYGAYTGKECIGLVVYKNGIEKSQPVSFDSKDKMSYLAEVAVLPEYRNTGLGTNLMLYAVLDAKIRGYKNMYMRTIGAGSGKSMSAGIAQKIGFNIIPNITQMTQKERTVEGLDENINHIFLKINLESLNKEKIKSAMNGFKNTKSKDEREI